MAESNRNYGQQPPGEDDREENEDEASNYVDNPRHTPRRCARPIYEETPAAHIQPMFGGFQDLRTYHRPSRRFLRHVAYLNSRVVREPNNVMVPTHNARHHQAATPPAPRRCRHRGGAHVASPPPDDQQCEMPPPQDQDHQPPPRGSAAYNAHVPPRHRFRGPIGRYANSHFQQSRAPANNPAVVRNDALAPIDHPDHVSEDSGIVSVDNPPPAPAPAPGPQRPPRFGGGELHNANPEDFYVHLQYRQPGTVCRFRYSGYYNPPTFYQQPSFVPQVQEPGTNGAPCAGDGVPREIPSTVNNSQFPQPLRSGYEPPVGVNAIAGPSHQAEPRAPYYEGAGALCPYHSSVMDYCQQQAVPYPEQQQQQQPPPASMLAPRPPYFTPAPPLEPSYYSTPSTSYGQLHPSISCPYTYPYTGSFYPPQTTTRPFIPFRETTYYATPNPPMTYYYPQPTPAIHYPVFPPNMPYPNYSEPTEQAIIPIRVDPPAAPQSVSSSEGNVSPRQSTTPNQRNLPLQPSEERATPAARVTPQSPGHNAFIHTFVPSGRFPLRSMPPPFAFIGISSESRRRQITGNLYYFCDLPSGQTENENGDPEYFLYECSTCPVTNQPCQQWVMVTPRRFPTSTVPPPPQQQPQTAPASVPMPRRDAEDSDQSDSSPARGDFVAAA